MPQYKMIDCQDPRTSIAPNKASMKDNACLQAIQLLHQAIQASEATALSAQQLGVLLQIIAIKENDLVRVILNPRYHKLARPRLIAGHPHPQCHGMRRDLWHYDLICVSGSDMSDNPIEITREGSQGLDLQLAMASMGNRPFGWQTPYHQMWLSLLATPLCQHHARVNTGLYSLPSRGDSQHELVRSAPDMMAWRMPGAPIAGEIDGLDPMRPRRLADLMLLTLCQVFSRCQTVMLDGVEGFGLAVALRLSNPGMSLHIGASPWPMQAAARLGLTDGLVRHAFTPGSMPPSPQLDESLDAIVVDASHHPERAALDDAMLRTISTKLSKTVSSLLILTGAPDPALEERLKRRFHALYAFTLPESQTIYVARQTEMPAERIWAGFEHVLTLFSRRDLMPLIVGQGVQLRKDDQRVPL